MRAPMLLWTVVVAVIPLATTAEPTVETWVGHQVLEGKRKVPLYGEQQTHTENFVIAEVRRSAGRIDVRHRLCRMEIRPVKGVSVTMASETIARLPKSHPVFEVSPDGKLSAAPWSTGWNAEDIDADGLPGATLYVGGSKCTGQVYVSNQATTTLTSGHVTADGIAGRIEAVVKQKVLGASGFCLKLLAGDSDERQVGSFAYRRVRAGTTCHGLVDQPWPVKAPLESAGGGYSRLAPTAGP